VESAGAPPALLHTPTALVTAAEPPEILFSTLGSIT
jgi:hypothetical protein